MSSKPGSKSVKPGSKSVPVCYGCGKTMTKVGYVTGYTRREFCSKECVSVNYFINNQNLIDNG